ncbi:MAG: homoserine dehydrogenase [Anaerolineales bacterium]
MPHYTLAFLGFGNVGRALARLLLRKQDELKTRYDLTFSVTGIATGRRGFALNPHGLDLERALQIVESGGNLSQITNHQSPITDNLDFIRASSAHVLFENTPVSYNDGEPAVTHIRTALELGMHALTANKGPVVHAYRELTALAKAKGVHFFHESTVMDGAPIFSLFRGALPGAQLLSFRGVLNSTTNLILGRMENGESFDDAVKYAQAIGIAETDPSGDVDGWDAAIKVSALVTVLMDIPLKPHNVDRTGIGGLTAADIARAQAEGKRWKLVCSATRTANGVTARVAPELVGAESPMFGVSGTSSIVQFETDVLGLLSVVEDNPGPHTTAYGLLADFLNAVR